MRANFLPNQTCIFAHLKVLEQQETSNVNKWTDDRFKDQTHAFKMHLLTRMQNSNASYAVSLNIHNEFPSMIENL